MTTPQHEVLVNFQYEYTARNGRQISIKPNERYILLAKKTDHWWFVRKDESTQPFFIPAQYITVLPFENEPLPPPDDLPIMFSDTDPLPEPPQIHEDLLHSITQDALQNSSSSVEMEEPYAMSPPHFPTVSSASPQTDKHQLDLSEDIQMLTRAGWDPSMWTPKTEQIYQSVDAVKDPYKSRKEETDLDNVIPHHTTSTPLSTHQGPETIDVVPHGFGDKVQNMLVYLLHLYTLYCHHEGLGSGTVFCHFLDP